MPRGNRKPADYVGFPIQVDRGADYRGNLTLMIRKEQGMGNPLVVQNASEIVPINAAVVEQHHRKSGSEEMRAIVLVNDDITRFLKHMIVQFLEDAIHIFL